MPIARTALGKAWTSIAGEYDVRNEHRQPAHPDLKLAFGVARDWISEIDAKLAGTVQEES